MNISVRMGLNPTLSTWWDFGEVPNLRPMYIAGTPRPPDHTSEYYGATNLQAKLLFGLSQTAKLSLETNMCVKVTGLEIFQNDSLSRIFQATEHAKCQRFVHNLPNY